MPPFNPSALTSDQPFVLLDDLSAARDVRQSRLYQHPLETICCTRLEDVEATLRRLGEVSRQGRHAAGWICYEAGQALEPKLAALDLRAHALPLIWFGIFEERLTLDRSEVAALLAALVPPGSDHHVSDVTVNVPAEEYVADIADIKDHIRAGDTYQVNYTMKLRFTLHGHPLSLYRALRDRQEAEFAALIRSPYGLVASLSPELFFEKQGALIRCRPMKGTARRGLTPAEDLGNEQFLLEDPKSRAENVMIVDLLRNDLGAVAETGTVKVDRLFEVERYRTLLQMTSSISARVPEQMPIHELLRPLFPCGSVTGAPKIRTMQLIRDLEREPRGIYTGSIGHLSPDGDACFNVAIRTLVISDDGRGEMGIGSGVVHDSDALQEYDECMLKARFLTGATRQFALIETLAWYPGEGYRLLSAHCDRLVSSCQFFRIPCDRERVLAALQEQAGQFSTEAQRVRLRLAADGTLDISSTNLTDAPAGLITVGLSGNPVHSSNPFLYHKTTNREFHEQEWARLRRERRWQEALLVNERGLLTGACRGNLFIRTGGILHTPALSGGVLPGTLRRSLLEQGQAVESELRPEMLQGASEILIGNSVRGLTHCRLADDWDAELPGRRPAPLPARTRPEVNHTAQGPQVLR